MYVQAMLILRFQQCSDCWLKTLCQKWKGRRGQVSNTIVDWCSIIPCRLLHV